MRRQLNFRSQRSVARSLARSLAIDPLETLRLTSNRRGGGGGGGGGGNLDAFQFPRWSVEKL